MQIAGKVVVITGASQGIGEACAAEFTRFGARLSLSGRDENRLRSAAPDALYTAGDITSPEVRRSLVDRTMERYGAIDILINNAGIRGGNDQSLEATGTDDWIEAFKVMTIGPFRVVQAFLGNLRAAKNPKVVTITSQIAATTWPTGGFYSYASTKAAVNRVMLGLARDLKDEVIVALVHPGWVKTDMGGPGADITPQESASGICSVIASLSKANTGKFYKWNGEIHPW